MQDLPIKNVKFCMAVYNWGPERTAKYEPVYQNRVKYAPRVKGTQPTPVKSEVANPWLPNVEESGVADSYKTVCTTVPWVKARGRQKVNFLYSSEVCSTNVVFRGWVEYENPFATLPSAIAGTTPPTCKAARSTQTAPNGTDTYNTVRDYGVRTYAPSHPPNHPHRKIHARPPLH